MKTYKIDSNSFETAISIPVKIVNYFGHKHRLTEDEKKELYEAIQYYKTEIDKDVIKQLDEHITRFKTFLR
jgi:hypothetical protein